MSKENRGAFRLDVSLPVHIEPYSAQQKCLLIPQEQVMKGVEGNLERQSEQIKFMLADEQYCNSSGAKMFRALDDKIDLMAFLLEHVINGTNPLAEDSYKQRMNDNQENAPKNALKNPKMMLFMKKVYSHVDHYIHELNSILEQGVKAQINMHLNPMYNQFELDAYLPGITQKATEGSWAATMIVLLTTKLNLCEQMLANLKEGYQQSVDPSDWKKQTVNLAQGGFSIITKEDFSLNQKICALFWADNQLIYTESSCVNVSVPDETDPQEGHRAAFKFDLISSDDESRIVRFINGQELKLQNRHSPKK